MVGLTDGPYLHVTEKVDVAITTYNWTVSMGIHNGILYIVHLCQVDPKKTVNSRTVDDINVKLGRVNLSPISGKESVHCHMTCISHCIITTKLG